ncbi:MAG: class I SAM-dependent methyltransferase [Desulfarculaceae bacterium]|nr:class I SAM-dependent methyltransferase [Desulfarculaceae bacterium]
MEEKIAGHYCGEYDGGGLQSRIVNALEAAGKNPYDLEPRDLSVIDQLHTGGHLATREMAEKAGFRPEMEILDAGCGIGGTSRLLAKEFGCRVTGIDLVDEFVSCARFLTESTGLEDLAKFETGGIEDLAYPEERFDAVLCQHTLMNIEDKAKVFAEFRRVLKPSGLLILHEVVQEKETPIALPVPWAQTPEISFLVSSERFKSFPDQAGFETVMFQTDRERAESWWRRVRDASEKSRDSQKPLGPHVIFREMGPQFGANMLENVRNRFVSVIQGICKNPGDYGEYRH